MLTSNFGQVIHLCSLSWRSRNKWYRCRNRQSCIWNSGSFGSCCRRGTSIITNNIFFVGKVFRNSSTGSTKSGVNICASVIKVRRIKCSVYNKSKNNEMHAEIDNWDDIPIQAGLSSQYSDGRRGLTGRSNIMIVSIQIMYKVTFLPWKTSLTTFGISSP